MSRTSSSSWATYTALAVGGCAISAGLLYYSYARRTSTSGDHLHFTALPTAVEAAISHTSQQSITAEPSASSSSESAANNDVSSAAHHVQECGNCRRTDAQLLRCSRCKQAAYCSVECQRKAWPSHKAACKKLKNQAAAATASNGVHPTSNGTPPATNGAVTPTNETENGNGAPHQTTSSSNSPSSSPRKSDKDLSTAVLQYLGQATSSKADALDNTYETAFFHFVRTEYRTAIELFIKAREGAKEAKRGDMQGECCKWLGHCYSKLADFTSAAQSFLAGHELGSSLGKHKLVVDCLSGLGCMYRGQADTENALKYLKLALAQAEAASDVDCIASVQCNLGATLMPVDIPAAVACLRIALNLREAQVGLLHEQGESSKLAMAIMEHASASMNLAGGLYAQKEHAQAEEAFVQALKVFEMVEEVDKIEKVLINLANLTELEMPEDPEAHIRALAYRKKLFEYVYTHQKREPSDICSICLEELNVHEVSAPDNPLILLACFHCMHNKCWREWAHESCPTCKQPVTLV